jgi:GTP-binding protein
MEDEKKITWSNCEFKIGAVSIDDIPPTGLPEIAFAGRSNVGKSSLINALTGRNSLVRTSRTPGCTKQLNFFELNEKIYMVDMPGYGYAKQSKKTIAGWDRLIQDYLTGRPNLKRIFLLIDSRHGYKPTDLKIMDLLDDKAVSYQIVFTKADKKTSDFKKVSANFAKFALKHPAMHPEYLLTSSHKKEGVEELREAIAEFL